MISHVREFLLDNFVCKILRYRKHIFVDASLVKTGSIKDTKWYNIRKKKFK
jgi:hypothetical protein